MLSFMRQGVIAITLVLATPGIAAASGCAPCPSPEVTLVDAGPSMIYVEWSSDVSDVVDFTVSLDQSGVLVDEQTVAGDVTAASFFGVAIGTDYRVSVTANTATDSFASSPSDPVSVTEDYIEIDPPVHITVKIDPSAVTLTLSEDGSTWVASLAAIDQAGRAGIYGISTSDGQSCWAFSASDVVEGDVVSCGIDVADDASMPEVTAAYYQEDYVMYAMRDGSVEPILTAGGEGDTSSVECAALTGESTDTMPECSAIDPRTVPTPFDDVMATSSLVSSSQPGTGVSVAVAVAGLLASMMVMRPRRRSGTALID